MNATLSRTDVLKPLAWLVGILGTAVLIMVGLKAPEWLQYATTGFFLAGVTGTAAR